MPQFEMTITLEDVAYILGLRVIGKAVTGKMYKEAEDILGMVLGQHPSDPTNTKALRSGCVKLTWLRNQFSHLQSNASEIDVIRATRAYLLHLLGTTIFANTSGNMVSVSYLPLLADFVECAEYAWGAATLAFLYRALMRASRKNTANIGGSMTLFTVWAYERLGVGRPDVVRLCRPFPRAVRWKCRRRTDNIHNCYRPYRQELDQLKECEVNWQPYATLASAPLVGLIGSYIGLARTWLIHFNVVEMHLPDRCLRQFGLEQNVPQSVARWQRHTVARLGIDYKDLFQREVSEWTYFNDSFEIVNAPPESNPGITQSNYLQWYLRVSHVRIHPPHEVDDQRPNEYRLKGYGDSEALDLRRLIHRVTTKLRPLLEPLLIDDVGVEINELVDTLAKEGYDDSCPNTYVKHIDNPLPTTVEGISSTTEFEKYSGSDESVSNSDSSTYSTRSPQARPQSVDENVAVSVGNDHCFQHSIVPTQITSGAVSSSAFVDTINHIEIGNIESDTSQIRHVQISVSSGGSLSNSVVECDDTTLLVPPSEHQIIYPLGVGLPDTEKSLQQTVSTGATTDVIKQSMVT
ncbi:protein MAIN-LIKE 1-like isoform X1 [Macadamia integrifolia]|uniref:protein MAIN-LIKE 1-like isoform X1 n=1 Tax=Macadamia integrifolia TaxID=60698 RepID=UPI001C4FF9AF|nr:protein MAIN-LIKE 1-like isoform X1 [Macadamia integrifolia]XP_042497363.1 protein MAIN-LIKE 1-like isoform X1 [Macadamia integrifolia]XP_042497364.1 protein MAIN-LIKE 1-like isoform X1 [Macadamia integrifolia]XP_042497365.1 protein MAIN-LIKE 1-like isoform X1 [Macadamia integrifolia]